MRRNEAEIQAERVSRQTAVKAWLDVKAERDAANQRIRELEAALAPSVETKAAYHGEFNFDIDCRDDLGGEYTRNVTVPWTTVKEIMAKILDFAPTGSAADDSITRHVPGSDLCGCSACAVRADRGEFGR